MIFSTTRVILACVSALAAVARAEGNCDNGIRLAESSKEFYLTNNTAGSVRHIDYAKWLLYSGPEHQFNITWECADASLPVLVQWTINGSDSTGKQKEIRWGRNLTTDFTDQKLGNGTFWWKPAAALSDVTWDNDTFTPKVSTDEARAQASLNWNYISVSQPEKGPSKPDHAQSQPFTLQSDRIFEFMQSQYKSGSEAEYRKWLMAVVPGVIIGILIFTLFGVYIGYSIEKRQIYKRQTLAARY